MAAMKYESSLQNHSFSMVEIDVPEIKCVKRRRRRPSAAPLPNNNPLDRPQQSQTLQADQATATTTTTTVKRSSRFRGVSRHRWTGRYEAHLWDKGSWNMTRRKKGKQVYLGAFDEEVSAARAYDLAAIKYWGTSTVTNFPISDYTNEIKLMQHVTKEEYLASLRRRSNGFARGASKYRGVARHHHNGRWEARIGRVFGNKYLYLGTYNTQEEAAHAYDIAAIEYKGLNAVTNFDMNTYIRWPKPGAHSPCPDSSAMQTISTEINPSEAPAVSYNSNSYTTGGFSFSCKQEVAETKLPLSPCNKPASPTALSLLHRSSMYKELKAKNPNAGNEERVGNNIYNNSQSGVEDDFTFFNSNAAYLCSYNTEKLPKLESPGNTASPLHDQARQTVQFLLNDFNMPPSIH